VIVVICRLSERNLVERREQMPVWTATLCFKVMKMPSVPFVLLAVGRGSAGNDIVHRSSSMIEHKRKKKLFENRRRCLLGSVVISHDGRVTIAGFVVVVRKFRANN
jgi:hypothetical protein